MTNQNPEQERAYEELMRALDAQWSQSEELCELYGTRFILEFEPYGRCFTGPAGRTGSSIDRVMFESIDRNDLNKLELSLAAGADLQTRDNWGRTAAHRAAAGKKIPCLRVLLIHGADFDAVDDIGRTVWKMLTAEQVDYFQREQETLRWKRGT